MLLENSVPDELLESGSRKRSVAWRFGFVDPVGSDVEEVAVLGAAEMVEILKRRWLRSLRKGIFFRHCWFDLIFFFFENTEH